MQTIYVSIQDGIQKGTQKQNIPVKINKQTHQLKAAHPAVFLTKLPELNPHITQGRLNCY